MLISIVVPAYREEKNIPEFVSRVVTILEKITGEFEIIFSIDPSPDRTEEVVLECRAQDQRIKLLRFSRRIGQPMATLGGLHYSSGEAVIVMDVDLQGPPELIPEMIERWRDGFDVVYAQRRNREGETWLKRVVSALGYRLINKIADVNIPPNTGDFRLMSRQVVDALLQMHERHRFLRGMVAWLGFAQTAVKYSRAGRAAGRTKYNLRKMLSLAWNASISFSPAPLRVSLMAGVFIALLGACHGVYAIIHSLVIHDTVPGWTTLVVLLSLIGGWILVSIGVLGEYVAKLFEEVKGRPLYVLAKRVNLPDRK